MVGVGSSRLCLAVALCSCLTPRASSAQDEADVRPSEVRPAAAATVALFDGATLAGWVTKGGRYDGAAMWTVEDGAITGRVGPGNKGGLIYTERAWHSFELELETRIDFPFDSGIFLRMTPDAKGAQVTLDHRPDGEIGGVYSEGWLFHNPFGKSKFRADEWNRVRVRCTGRDFRIEAWLNGDKITDYRLPKGSDGYADTGLLGLQVHGGRDDPGRAQFRDIRLRELPVFDLDEFTADDAGVLTPIAEDWEPLIDAELSKWEEASGFAVRDEVLILLEEGDSPELRTKDDFEDFVFRLDFKIGFMCNSGIFLRAARDATSPAYSGCEIQVLDDFNWATETATQLQPWQLTGSLYGAVSPGVAGAMYPLGQWNSYRIRCQGTRIRCELNGVLLYDVDTSAIEPVQGKPFGERAGSGFIGIQRHAPANVQSDAYAWFRNVFVQRL